MTRDSFDARLSDLFHPGEPPRGFSGRIVRAAAARAAGADRLARRILDRLSFQASARGITRLRPGRLPTPTGASARRLIDRAHSELREYFDGRRAYFTVPIDLSELPGFQKSVLRATSRIPFGETMFSWIPTPKKAHRRGPHWTRFRNFGLAPFLSAHRHGPLPRGADRD